MKCSKCSQEIEGEPLISDEKPYCLKCFKEVELQKFKSGNPPKWTEGLAEIYVPVLDGDEPYDDENRRLFEGSLRLLTRPEKFLGKIYTWIFDLAYQKILKYPWNGLREIPIKLLEIPMIFLEWFAYWKRY